MVLVQASSTRLEFATRSSLKAPLFTAAVLAVMSALPLLAPGPTTAFRLVFAVALFAVAAGLLATSRRRWRRVRMLLDAGQLELGERSVPLASARSIALTTGGSTREGALRTRYRAELVL